MTLPVLAALASALWDPFPYSRFMCLLVKVIAKPSGAENNPKLSSFPIDSQISKKVLSATLRLRVWDTTMVPLSPTLRSLAHVLLQGL